MEVHQLASECGRDPVPPFANALLFKGSLSLGVPPLGAYPRLTLACTPPHTPLPPSHLRSGQARSWRCHSATVSSPPFTIPAPRETPLSPPCRMSFHPKPARQSSCYSTGRDGGVEHLPVGVNTLQGTPPAPSHPRRQPRPDPARTYPLHILATRGARASVPRAAAAIAQRSPRAAPAASPPAADSAPGQPGCPAACQSCPLPVGLCGPGSRPGPQSLCYPALGGSRGRGVAQGHVPAPPLRRPTRRTRARSRPSPAPAALPGRCDGPSGGGAGPRHPAASTALRRSQLTLLQTSGPARPSAAPSQDHPCSRAYHGFGLSAPRVLADCHSRPADTLPPPHPALRPSLLPWPPCSAPVSGQLPSW